MSQERTTNIPYTTNAVDDPLRQFDIYHATQDGMTPSLICFVHGGAWVSGDKQEHELLAKRLVAATGYPVAVPNYRLTPRSNTDPSYRHPMHVRDLLDFLEFITSWNDAPCSYNPSRLILIGHSCGAHMISSLFFLPMESERQVIPGPRIIEFTRAVILSEGIYDVSSLLQTFPKYRQWFVEAAFGTDSYYRFSILNTKLHHGAGFPWLLIHSQGDTLVDVCQTTDMHHQLRSLQTGVQVSLFDVVGDHDAILETEKYVEVVKKFLISQSSNL